MYVLGTKATFLPEMHTHALLLSTLVGIRTSQVKFGQPGRVYTSYLVSFETPSRKTHSEFLKLDERRMLIFYFALISYSFPPPPPPLPLIPPTPPPTSPCRHTRLVGSSLQLFVQAGALLWADSRAFLGVNFNELGTGVSLSASFYIHTRYFGNRCTLFRSIYIL